jgi:hypothetical protein
VRSYGKLVTASSIAALKSLQFSTCIFNACSMIIGLQYHFDRHVWDVPVENFAPGRALSLAVQVSFAFSTTLTKVSALVFFSRLNGPKRNWICRIAMAVCVTQGVMFSFMDIFQCKLVFLSFERSPLPY